MRRRSNFSVRDIFEELRFNYDVTKTITQADVVQFAGLSGCSDLIEEAWLTTEAYQRRVEDAGGMYPVDEMRKSFTSSLYVGGVNITGFGRRPRRNIVQGITRAPGDRIPAMRNRPSKVQR